LGFPALANRPITAKKVNIEMKTMFVSLILAFFCAHSAIALAGEPVPKKRFISEGHQSWLKYREYAKRLSGTSVRKTFINNDLTFHSEIELFQTEKRRRLVTKVLTGKGLQEAYCENPEYFFSLYSQARRKPLGLNQSRPR
jgi:hypothetical protein